MATRININIKRPGVEEYASIYCHWDGYLSHNGKILLKNYNTYDKVVALISEGDISSLGESINTCNSYFHMDNGDKHILVSSNLQDHIREAYIYLFKDNKWWYKYTYNITDWKELTLEMCEFD